MKKFFSIILLYFFIYMTFFIPCYSKSDYTVSKVYQCAKTGKIYKEIMKNNKVGIENSEGKIIVPVIFDETKEFFAMNKIQFFLCKKNGIKALYSIHGEEIIPLKIKTFIKRFGYCYVVEYINGKYSLMGFDYDTEKIYWILNDEEFIDDYVCDRGDDFYIILKRNGKFGLLSFNRNSGFNTKIDFEYDDIFNTLSAKYCFVKKGDKWFVADMETGEFQTQFEYDDINKTRAKYRKSSAFAVTKDGEEFVHDLYENKCYTVDNYKKHLDYEDSKDMGAAIVFGLFILACYKIDALIYRINKIFNH